MSTVSAARSAWRWYGVQPGSDLKSDRYHVLWSWYDGSWRNSAELMRQRQADPRLYKNTVLVWNLSRAVVRLYAQTVYQGDLSTDGQPLSDGSRGAIPIDPQAGADGDDDTANEQLLRACAELFSIWNWRQHMAIRPKMAAILGDCLTELVDDVERAKVMPVTIWPGYVTDLQLDHVGNVKRYTLEYDVDLPESRAYGRYQPAEQYRYRKEVDGETFRFFKNGEPFDYDGGGAVRDNPYTFVPAVWDRHELAWGDRGIGAFESGLQTMSQLNSVLSHAIDYQRKQFAAPVGVKGNPLQTTDRKTGLVSPTLLPDVAAEAAAASDRMSLLPLDDSGEFVTVTLDVGKTVELLHELRDTLTSEFPESRYFQEILGMTQVTAPGIERALGPIISSVKQARANLDPGTVKLLQMSIAMMGWRVQSGAYPAEIVNSRTQRYDAFRPFDLNSYGQGLLDMTIADRPVISETPQERIANVLQLQSIKDRTLMQLAGVSQEIVDAVFKEREARQQQLFEQEARAFDFGAQQPPANE